MRIAIAHDASLPVSRYGGAERAVWWLAKGLSEAGHTVKLVCRAGSSCPFATVIPADFSRPIPPQVSGYDLLHFFHTPATEPTVPYVVTIQGNGRPGETFLRNTAFISRDHARRHGSDCFVYNGVDPAEYEFRDRKDPYLLFLAKASWRVKNVKGAIRVARAAGKTLHILGGESRLSWLWRRRGIHWEGMLGGPEKTRFLAGAAGLLFPVLWHEPFGIAVAEALVSGTPVLATPYGSLPELVPPVAGKICATEAELAEAVPHLGSFRARDCREWALSTFHYARMTGSYLSLYAKVLNGEPLNAEPPRTMGDAYEV